MSDGGLPAVRIERHCQRDLAKEGPCYGPVMSPNELGIAAREVDGRFLCDNHIVLIHGAEVYYGPRDTSRPYHISPHGFYEGEIAVGQFVKVLFVTDPHSGVRFSGEGMWVKVSSIDGDRIAGTLDNAPAGEVGAVLGDVVEFPRSAVRAVMS